MGNGRKDFCNLKAIKERSNRIEDGAKKQNEYQERRLNKYITGIEKEHESNMLMLRAQERELRKSEGRLNEHLSKKRESTSCGSLPPINQSEMAGQMETQEGVQEQQTKKRKNEAWIMDQKTKESVLERILNIPAPVTHVNPYNEDEEIKPTSFHNSGSDSKNIKFPPLLKINESLMTNG